MAAHKKPIDGTCEKCGVAGHLFSAGAMVMCKACHKLTKKVKVEGRKAQIIAGIVNAADRQDFQAQLGASIAQVEKPNTLTKIAGTQ